MSLPATVRLAWHTAEPFPRQVALGELYAPLEFPIRSGALPYLVANMVMTQNGEATVAGKATTIGTAVDGLVLARIRRAVDAVLTGSGTLVYDDVTAVLPEAEVRRRIAEGRSPRLLVVVVASSLSFGREIYSRRFFADPGFDKLMMTGPAATPERIRAVEDRGVEVVRVSASDQEGRLSLPAVLGILKARGMRAVTCEGGPRFLPSLFRARAVREYFLTTSPMITGALDAPRPVSGPIRPRGAPVLLSRLSRYEHDFDDPRTGARLVEAFDRFHVIYPP